MLSKKSSQSVIIIGFGQRLRSAFNGASNADIAKELKVSEPAIGNYMKGRVTLPIVMQVAEKTGCSVDWLLTGEIPHSQDMSFDKVLEKRIREIVREEINRQPVENNNENINIKGKPSFTVKGSLNDKIGAKKA